MQSTLGSSQLPSPLSLLSCLPQVHLLSMLCQEQSKERYSRTVEQLVSAARQIRDEVASMEVDILVGQSMAQLLEKNRSELESSIKNLQLEASIAAGESPLLLIWTTRQYGLIHCREVSSQSSVLVREVVLFQRSFST